MTRRLAISDARIVMRRPSWWLIAVAAVACGATACSGDGGGTNATRPGASTTSGPPATSSATNGRRFSIGVASWQLAAPIANEVLVSDGRQLTILGGLDATKLSTRSVVRVDPGTGTSQAAGSLSEAV